MNRDRVKITWKFNPKTARRKFGYKRNSFRRSETYGPPLQNRVGVHFFEDGATIIDFAAWNRFQTFGLRDSFLTGVRFEIPDYDIYSRALKLLGLLQHLVSLSGPSVRKTLSFPRRLGVSGVRENSDIHTLGGFD